MYEKHQHARVSWTRRLGLCAVSAKQSVTAGISVSSTNLSMKLFHETSSKHCINHFCAIFSWHDRSSDPFPHGLKLWHNRVRKTWKLKLMIFFHHIYLTESKQEFVYLCTVIWRHDCLIGLFCNTSSLATKTYFLTTKPNADFQNTLYLQTITFFHDSKDIYELGCASMSLKGSVTVWDVGVESKTSDDCMTATTKA